MIYKKGVIFKKTNARSGCYIIGKLIRPLAYYCPTNKPQLWEVEIYHNSNYLRGEWTNNQTITIPPSATLYTIETFESYEKALAVMI